MKVHDVKILGQVEKDLKDGREFYNFNELGVGSYFFDSIVSDIESLRFYAGIHSTKYGLYKMLAKRFPFAIYYDIKGITAIVVAVLDLRRNPALIRKKLNERVHKKRLNH